MQILLVLFCFFTGMSFHALFCAIFLLISSFDTSDEIGCIDTELLNVNIKYMLICTNKVYFV